MRDVRIPIRFAKAFAALALAALLLDGGVRLAADFSATADAGEAGAEINPDG
jgi:hypothetical protein